MNNSKFGLILFNALFLLSIQFHVLAQYSETMDPEGLTKNLVTDYGVKADQPDLNQSTEVQNAIDDLASLGGGRLIIPKGEYRFSKVALKSNIHILVEANTILRPYWPEGTKTNVFTFGAIWDRENPSAYIENVSIRGIDGRFIVDYSDRIRKDKEGCRAIVISMIKNFLVQDMDVKDNFSTYCGMVLSPVKQHSSYTLNEVKTWDVSRATDGTIRDCRHFNASPGYGLVQLHGAQSILFENLYSLGGVTLRLETGANNEHVGVYDITGKNIYCENGRCALMMGPHSAKNGVVTVDSIVVKSCTYAVTIGDGGVKEDAPDQTPGYFSNDSKITNIHVIFGKTAQIKNQSILSIPEAYYDDLKLWPDNKFLTGPSIGAVSDHTVRYHVTVENITMEGFEFNNNKKIMTEADIPEGDKWQEWDQWKTDYLDDDHKTQNAAVVVEYDIPEKTFNDFPISFEDRPAEVLGVNNIERKVLTIYPNPAKHVVNIRGEGSQNQVVDVFLYDVQGRTMKQKEKQFLNATGVSLDLNGLSSGFFILKVLAHGSGKMIGVSNVFISR